jgi:hypothetical protein
MVNDELVVNQVGQPPLKAAEGFLRDLALAAFPLVVPSADVCGVADLRNGYHVQYTIDSLVSGPGEPVTDRLAGGDAGRGGVAEAGEWRRTGALRPRITHWMLERARYPVPQGESATGA